MRSVRSGDAAAAVAVEEGMGDAAVVAVERVVVMLCGGKVDFSVAPKVVVLAVSLRLSLCLEGSLSMFLDAAAAEERLLMDEEVLRGREAGVEEGETAEAAPQVHLGAESILRSFRLFEGEEGGVSEDGPVFLFFLFFSW